MSKKSGKIAQLIEKHRGSGLDPHYLGYFDLFNQGLYYEAHDVLEELWLPSRRGPDDLFYKGLIQFAGAFVHLQKGRLKPAGALFRLARANLERYPGQHHGLAPAGVVGLADAWLGRLEASGYAVNPWEDRTRPILDGPDGSDFLPPR